MFHSNLITILKKKNLIAKDASEPTGFTEFELQQLEKHKCFPAFWLNQHFFVA